VRSCATRGSIGSRVEEHSFVPLGEARLILIGPYPLHCLYNDVVTS
jgi:hypothetical protein